MSDERRTKRRLDTNRASSSSAPRDLPDHEDPWWKEEHEPIITFEDFPDPKRAVMSPECRNRALRETWDDYDSLFYNAWQGVDIIPTRVADLTTLRILGIREDFEAMISELRGGNIFTQGHALYPDLVRQFLATAQVLYEGAGRVASQATLTFFIRGIRYRISIRDLCEVYGFSVTPEGTTPPAFPGLSDFWTLIARGPFNSSSATQTDIRHPTLRYFAKLLANTLLCKTEPNKVRKPEATILYMAVRDLVDLDAAGIPPPEDEMTFMNLGAVFAEHLATIKYKPFKGKSSSRKEESIGSLLTPIFRHLGISLRGASVVSERSYMDLTHLTSTQWLKERKFWSYIDAGAPRLISLPRHVVTDFADDPERLAFHPDINLTHDADLRMRERGGLRNVHGAIPGAAPEPQQQAPFPAFPELPQVPIHDHGDFQRVVLDALQAIWARVETLGRCRCFTRPRRRARSPEQQQEDVDTDEE